MLSRIITITVIIIMIIHKTAILGTAHILWKVLALVSKYKTFVVGNIVTYTMYCNYNLAAMVCTLETWYVLVCSYNCKYSA